MSLIDLVFLILAGLAVIRGWRRGFLGLVFELGGGFLGLLAGLTVGGRVASLFTNSAGVEGLLIALLAVFVCLTVGQTLGYLAGRKSGAYAKDVKLGGINSGLGAVAGLLVTAISFWLVGSLLVHSSSRPVAKALKRSVVLGALTDALPRPPNVIAFFTQYLNTHDFPQVFQGFPPALGPPVKLPSNALANRAIEAADQSTVRVIVPACGGTQLGSGWIAANATVVTNAHVVAGGADLTVQTASGENVAGNVVLFDKDTDVAVIRLTQSVSAPPLRLETQSLERGQPGATLGYPGDRGGRAEYGSAAIQQQLNATGLDIYGLDTVTRDVYELRASIRQGDSGGPFVLPNGRVAGVLFAASTENARRGYALTGGEVADEVAEGSQHTTPVGTGGCTH
jgi:S1-C subfamily serine protease